MSTAILTDRDILDLATGTLDELGRLRFTQIAQRLQHYEVMSRLMRQDRLVIESGTGVQRTIMVDHSNAAKMTGLYEVDDVNVGEVLKTITVDWRHTNTSYAWERREMLMNRGASRIVSLMKTRRADAMISLAELMESQFWNKPTDSTDKSSVWGVPYWIVSNSTLGFNGANASGFSNGPGGLDSTTYTRWKNFTGQYAAVTKTDLIQKMREAYRKIRFKSPVNIDDYRRGNGERYRIYVNNDTIDAMEQLGEAQNENLGRDLASMDGQMVFRRNPIVWVPQLDTDATDPVYMLDLGCFYPIFLRGDVLRESEPSKVSGQHNVWNVQVDLTWNVMCTDRRANAVLTL